MYIFLRHSISVAVCYQLYEVICYFKKQKFLKFRFELSLYTLHDRFTPVSINALQLKQLAIRNISLIPCLLLISLRSCNLI